MKKKKKTKSLTQATDDVLTEKLLNTVIKETFKLGYHQYFKGTEEAQKEMVKKIKEAKELLLSRIK